MSDSEDDENNKSVIVINEMSHKEQLKCKKNGCKNSTKFDDNSLIVKCQNCQGCYHPHCVDMDHLEHWLGFMKSKKNREYWQYTCYYCLKHVQTMVRIKELAVLISEAVKSNHTAIDNKHVWFFSSIKSIWINKLLWIYYLFGFVKLSCAS